MTFECKMKKYEKYAKLPNNFAQSYYKFITQQQYLDQV